MSKLHFLHSGGDKVTLTTPASNPSTNPVFKLPQTDGSSGQFLRTDGSGALSFATPPDTTGKVLQCKVNYINDLVTVSNTSGGQSSQYGLTGGRVYGNLNTIDITPVSSSSTMILQGVSGGTNSPHTYPIQGAYGIVCVLNENPAGAIDNTDYQYYQLQYSLHTSGYLPNTVCQGHYAAGNTNQQTWRLKGYAYTEGSNTCTIRYIKHHLIVWEVEI